ncbi:MAG: S41 family peptidase [Oscillospiraceae bacterium]|nr:S41 family peptidase [Oscillospiraceae bacterium]
MSRKAKLILAFIAAVTAAVIVAAFLTAAFLRQRAMMSRFSECDKLTQLEKLIGSFYIDDYDEGALEDAAAEAMIEALDDPWSYYVPAAEAEALNEQMNNGYQGVGITVAVDDGQCVVLAVQKDSPAQAADIRVGDILTAVDGTDVTGWTVDEIKDVVRGPEGTPVRLGIQRGDDSFETEITRSFVRVQVVFGQMLAHQIALIAIDNFTAGSAQQFSETLSELLAQGAKGLIFDVRFNPGGDRSELVEILDTLLPEGEIFKSVDYRGDTDSDTSDADCVDLPMAVIVHADSVSAAEYFAAALQEYGKAEIIGEQTVGKGNYQNTFTLRDGSIVGLSTGHYFTPNGKSLSGIGVNPDIKIALTDEQYDLLYYGQLLPEDDPQIQAAIQAVENAIGK